MQQSVYDSLSRDTALAAECLSIMMQSEQSTYKSQDYLDCAMITESNRMKIVDWCYGVIDHCKFDRETVAIAMEMVDRFLSTTSSPVTQDILDGDRNQFQLLAMSSLYIAVKTNERVAFGSEHFASMSRGAYTVQDIESMESTILNTLQWRVCAPTSVQMAHHILSLILPYVTLQESSWGLILDEVRFQIESSVRDYYFSMQRSSTVAMAAIFNALDQLSRHERKAILQALLQVVNKDFDSPEDLLAARNRLASLLDGDEDTDDTATLMSETAQEVEAWSSNEGYCQEAIVSPRMTSPRTVTCCRRENVLCESCVRMEQS